MRKLGTRATPSPEGLGDSQCAVVRDRVDRGYSAGIVVTVIELGRDASAFAYGDAGPAQEPLGLDTLFEIGSLTKVFTATVLASMARGGQLRLDEPVANHVPPAMTVPERAGRQITFEDLATHRSGLPRLPTNLHPADPTNPFADYTVDQFRDFLAAYALPRDVDSEYEYSNVGYGLLGLSLEHRGGHRLGQLLRRTILEPLGLDDTGFGVPAHRECSLALPHDDSARIMPVWESGALPGAGGLLSTMRELRVFALANIQPEGALGEAIKLAHTPRRDVRPNTMVGLGWHVYRPLDSNIIWHSGQTAGSHSFLGLRCDAGRAVIILSNSANSIDDIGFHFLDSRLPLRTFEGLEVPPEVLDRYVGIYELGPQRTVTITRTPHGLDADATGQGTAALEALSDTEFLVRIVDAHITFQVSDDGHVDGLVLQQRGSAAAAPKVV